MPKWPVGCPRQKEICVELERHMQPCDWAARLEKVRPHAVLDVGAPYLRKQLPHTLN